MTTALINNILNTKPHSSHICGNGAEMVRYNACVDGDYKALREAYEKNGYTLYCEETAAPILSATYIKDDEYAVLFYCRGINSSTLPCRKREQGLFRSKSARSIMIRFVPSP